MTETPLSDPAVAASGIDRDMVRVLGQLGTDDAQERDWWARPTATALLEQATPDARLPMVLLARVVAGIETTTGRSSWRTASGRLARYFRYLASVGYGVSDVERLVYGTEAPRRPESAIHPATPPTPC